MKQQIKQIAMRLRDDSEYRAEGMLYGTLAINLLYAIFKLVSGFRYASVWFGASAFYYLILAVSRFLLIRNVRNTGRDTARAERHIHAWKTYRNCGWLMFVLQFAMTGVATQMIVQNKTLVYPGHVIYLTAAYVFFCLVASGKNLISFYRREHPALAAAKMLSFAASLMSIFSLQVAMLARFGENLIFRRTLNIIVGSVICGIVFIMAVFMVWQSSQEIKRLKST